MLPDAIADRNRMLDRLAGVMEGVGFPHSIARVYAALTLAEGEGLSTSEITGQLGISKASVSNAMQFLVGTSLAERYRVRESREAHYRMLKGTWGQILRRKFAVMTQVSAIAQEAMASTTSPLARERLEEISEVYGFFEQEFEQVMKRWDERMGT